MAGLTWYVLNVFAASNWAESETAWNRFGGEE
jgi:hypothetical protein